MQTTPFYRLSAKLWQKIPGNTATPTILYKVVGVVLLIWHLLGRDQMPVARWCSGMEFGHKILEG